ncbi:hypothetical protein EMCRGX_G004654 [Ephydatia muelleri]|eukprot:Em0007g615a
MAGIVLSILGTAVLAAALWLGTRWLYGYCRMIYYIGRIPKPTPNGHWLFGHIFELPPCQSTMIKMIARNRSTGHALTATWVGPFISLVAITHPEPLKQLLKEPKSWIYHLLLPWLGDGLLVSNGPKWARNRRLLTPAFHYEILKPYVDVYNSCSEVLLNKWSALAKKNEPVMAFESVSLLTLDVVLQCAFSFKSDCQDTGTHAPYIKAVYDLSEWIVQRVIYPPYQSNLFFYLSPDGRKFRKACKLVHDHSEKVINERKKVLASLAARGVRPTEGTLGDSKKDEGKYLDFLDILLTAVDEEGRGLSDLDIRNEADTFMFEGHDTTASGICWTLYLLAKHPEHQEKCRDEIRSVLDGRSHLEFADLPKLQYTHWCIKEAMRLYPPVFQVFRDLGEDMMLQGHLVPKGCWLMIAIYQIHRCPEFWENPEEFNPLRFSSEIRHPYAYIPFSAGPRNCIGQSFAINEEKVVVSNILRRFELRVDDFHCIEMDPKVILKAKYDIKLHIKPLPSSAA